jgi:hypothetical protein
MVAPCITSVASLRPAVPSPPADLISTTIDARNGAPGALGRRSPLDTPALWPLESSRDGQAVLDPGRGRAAAGVLSMKLVERANGEFQLGTEVVSIFRDEGCITHAAGDLARAERRTALRRSRCVTWIKSPDCRARPRVLQQGKNSDPALGTLGPGRDDGDEIDGSLRKIGPASAGSRRSDDVEAAVLGAAAEGATAEPFIDL